MFRENVFTKEDVIDRIASTMIPVAVDAQKIADLKSKEARFLRPLLKQRKQEHGSPCIFSPEGKLLGCFAGYGDMAGRMRKLIESALQAFGPVKPRNTMTVERRPQRGKGVMSDGSVCLAEYVRASDQSLAFMNTKSPVISSVTLSGEEFSAFAPPDTVVGAKWPLLKEVAKKLCRITSPMCYQHAPQPDWVTDARLNAEVRKIKDGTAWLAYEGGISSAHRLGSTVVSVQETKLTGEGVYDLRTKRMRSVLLVGAGTLRWPEAPKKLVTFDALVEWVREAPESSFKSER